MIVRYSCGCTALHLHQPDEGHRGQGSPPPSSTASTRAMRSASTPPCRCGSGVASSRRPAGGDKTWEPVTTRGGAGDRARPLPRSLGRAPGARGRAAPVPAHAPRL